MLRGRKRGTDDDDDDDDAYDDVLNIPADRKSAGPQASVHAGYHHVVATTAAERGRQSPGLKTK